MQGLNWVLDRASTPKSSGKSLRPLPYWCAGAASQSVPYVRAEAKKGLDRLVLLPVALEQCDVPVPFNAIEAADFRDWTGDIDDPRWQRLVSKVVDLRIQMNGDKRMLAEKSLSAFTAVNSQIFPGVLALLMRRVAVVGREEFTDYQAETYHRDVLEILYWLDAIVANEHSYLSRAFRLAGYDHFNDHYNFWHFGVQQSFGRERTEKLDDLLLRLQKIVATLQSTRELLAQRV